MKTSFPLNVVTGNGLGVSYSSLTQIGSVYSAAPLGEARLNCYTNITTGNVIVFDYPVKAVERNFPVVLQFAYNSQAADAKQVWHFSHKQFKAPFNKPFPPQDSMVLVEEDGHETTYTLFSKTDRPTWVPPHCGEGRPYLQYDESLSLWVWFNPKTRITEYYDQLGRLLSRCDPLMRETTYEYASATSTVLKAIHAPSGNQYCLQKASQSDGSFTLSCVLIHPESESQVLQTWQFDAAQRLIKTTIPAPDATHPDYCIDYTYDLHLNAERQLLQIKQTDTSVLRFNYGLSGERCLEQAVIGAEGLYIRCRYSFMSGKNAYLADGPNGQSYFTVDGSKQLVKLERRAGIEGFDAPALVSQFQYTDNQITSILHADGGEERWTYQTINDKNIYGLIAHHQFANGEKRDYFYDSGHDYNAITDLHTLDTGVQEITRHVWGYHIQCANQKSPLGTGLRFTISPEGRVTEYRYDEEGEVSSQRIYLDGLWVKQVKPEYIVSAAAMEEWVATQDPSRVQLTTYQRDALGQIFVTKAFAAVNSQGEGIDDPQAGLVQTHFNLYGALTESVVKQSLGYEPAKTIYSLDALQRTSKITNALQQETICLFDQPGESSTVNQVTIQPNKRQDSIQKNSQGLTVSLSSTVLEDGISKTHKTDYQWSKTGWDVWLITNPDGQHHYEFYNRLGELAFTVSQTGIVKQWIHAVQARYRSTTEFAKPIDPSALIYNDLFPNPLLLKMAITKYGLLNDPNNRTAYEFLDTNEQVRFTVNAEMGIVETRYDSDSRVIGRIDYHTPVSESDLDTLKKGQIPNLALDVKADRCTRLFYDKDGLLIGQQDAAGYVTEHKLNGAGWIMQTIVYADPAPINWTVTRFDALRPTPNPQKDAHTYLYYNNRGGCELIVDAEGYVTTKSYLANGLVDKVRRYAQPLTTLQSLSDLRPLLPVKSKEDEVIQHEYDLLDNPVTALYAQDNYQTQNNYDCMGQLTATLTADDAVVIDENAPINGDNYRASRIQYDGFGRKTALANPLLSQKMAEVERDADLKPAEKTAALALLWQYYSTRFHYSDAGLVIHTLVSKADLSPMAAKNITPNLASDVPAYTYYDLESRPVIQITVVDDERVVIEEKTFNPFNEISTIRHYSQFTKAFPKEWISRLTGGELTKELAAILDSIKDNSHDPIVQETYNKSGLTTERIDAEGYPSHYSYNAFEECIEEQQCVQDQTPSLFLKRLFDVRGLQTESRQEADTFTVVIQKEYADARGLCTLEIDELGCQKQYTHDRLGRKTRSQMTVDGLPIDETLQWDSFNRVIQSTDSYGNATQHSYHREQREEVVVYAVDGVTETIKNNPFAQAVMRQDGLGNESLWFHNATGQKTKHTNPLQASTLRQYNLMDKMTVRQDARGILTTYTMDGLGYLLNLTRDAGEAAGHFNIKTTYLRNALNEAVGTIDARGQMTQRTFDRKGNALTVLFDPDNGDYKGLQLLENNTYNAQSQLITQTKGSVTAPADYEYQQLIDPLARPVGEIIDPKDLKLTSTRQLNAKGQSVRLVNPEGAVSWQIYNALGLKCYEIDPLGGVKQWVYNKNSLITQAITYENSLSLEALQQLSMTTTPLVMAGLVRADNQRDAVSYYFYDACNRERFRVKVVWDDWKASYYGIIEEKRYNTASQQTQTIIYANTIAVDAINTATLKDIETEVAHIADALHDAMTYAIYDAAGQLRFKIDPDNFIQETVYGAVGHVLMEIHYASAVIDAASVACLPDTDVLTHIAQNNERDRYTYHFYDALGREQFEINGEGSVIGYTYDRSGNRLTGCYYANTLAIPAPYTELATSLSRFTPDPQRDRVITHQYDAHNRCIKTIDAMGYAEEFRFNAVDSLVERVDKNQGITTFAYNGALHEIKKTTPAIQVTATEQLTNGSVKVKSQTVTRIDNTKEYNKVGQLTTQTFAAATADARTVVMMYNVCGKLVGTQIDNVPVDNGTPIVNSYRPETKTTIKTQIVYDAKQRKIAFADEDNRWTFYVRDNQGKLVFKINPGGATIQKIRDTQGRVQSQIHYATTYTFTNEPPFQQITAQRLSAFFKNHASEDDRLTVYHRDRRGNPVMVEAGSVYDYIPALAGEVYAAPLTDPKRLPSRKTYSCNAFKEIDTQTTWLNSQAKKDQLTWFNRSGNPVLQAQREGLATDSVAYSIDTSAYNCFGERIGNYQFQQLLQKVLAADMPLLTVKSWLIPLVGVGDRSMAWTYFQNGKLQSEQKINITRQSVVLGSTGIPSLADTHYDNLVTAAYEYDALGQLKSTTYPNSSKIHVYYDGVGNLIAQTGVAQSNGTTDSLLTPLTYFYYNAHGQMIGSTRFKLGTSPVKPDTFPQPIAQDAGDQIELRLFDNRGKTVIEQDARGNPKANAYTPSGQLSRYWQRVTNWQQSTLNKSLFDLSEVHVDQKAFTYDQAGWADSETTLRDNSSVSALYYHHNAFGEVEAKGLSSDKMEEFTRYDTLGHVWFTNRNGIYTVTLHNFQGMEVFKVESPVVDKVARLAYDTVLEVFKWPKIDALRTEKRRDVQGQVRSITFPASYVNNISTAIADIPLDVCIGSDYKAFGEISLTWPMVQEQTLTPIFSLWVEGEEASTAKQLTIKNHDGRSGVDVSDLNTDAYTYHIDYYFTLPSVNESDAPVKTATSSGKIQVITANTSHSQHCIPRQVAAGIIEFVGNVQGLTAAEVWQDGNRVGVAQPVRNNFLDLRTYPSGVYSFKPLINQVSQELSLALAVFTPIPVPAGQPPLSYEIPVSAGINTLQEHGELNWVVPLAYSTNNMAVVCVYTGDDDKDYSEEFLIDPYSLRKPCFDEQDHELLSNITFARPVKQVKSLSLSLQITTAKGQEFLPLYINNAAPDLVQPPTLDLIHQYPFPPKVIVYLSPWNGLSAAPTLLYLNTVLGSRAAQTELVSTGFTSEGFTLDVTGFSLGAYPFSLNGIDGVITIFQGSQCFLGPFGQQPPDVHELVQPGRTLNYDRWRNQILEVDAEGNQTAFAYNDDNARIEEILPAVNIVNEQGQSIPNFKPHTTYGHDIRGTAIGESWRLSNGSSRTQAWLCDFAHPIVHLLADGSYERIQVWNALGQIDVEKDSRGYTWERQYDLNSNLILSTSPEKFLTGWMYNERNEVILSNYDVSWRYNRDAMSNVSESYLPLGQKTTRLYDHNHHVIQQTTVQGDNVWYRNFFGQVMSHKDLKGGVTTYRYNGAGQLEEQIRQSGESSSYVDMLAKTVLMPAAWPFVGRYVNRTLYSPQVIAPGVVNQHLTFDYAFGRRVAFHDKVRDLSTTYGLSLEGRIESVRLKKTSSGEILREQDGKVDALGRELYSHDGQAVCVTSYDDEGNRRSVSMTVKDSSGGSINHSTWWKYDTIGELLVSGVLQNSQIVPVAGHGYQFTYEKGVRKTEFFIAANGQQVQATLQYSDDGRLLETSYNTTEKVTRTYHKSGLLKTYTQTRGNQPLLSRTIVYNGNGQTFTDVQEQHKDNGLHISETTYNYNAITGLLDLQYTNYHDTDQNSDTSTFTYRLKDSAETARIDTVRHNKHGDRTADSLIYQGPNGEMNAVLGATSSGISPMLENRYFTTTPDGMVFERNKTLGYSLQGERYFYTPSGNAIGSVEFSVDDNSNRYVSPFSNLFQSRPSTQSGGGLGFRSDRATRYTNSKLFTLARPISFDDTPMEQKLTGSLSPMEKGMTRGNWKAERSLLFLGLFGEQDRLGDGLRVYTVRDGDDYAAIAKQEFGDANLGGLISRANGGKTLSPGETIQIPQLMPSHNGPQAAMPYQLLVSIIEGNIMPYVSTPQPKAQHHHAFFKKLVSLLTMSIAIVLVVPSGGTSLGLGALVAGLLPEGVSLLMVNAVVAGLVDAALQGVLVGFGAKEFSIAEVISTSFAVAGAGWAGRAGGGAAAAKGIADYNFELTVESGIRVLSANIAEQLTLMAAGQQHHLDFKQAAAVMLGAGIDPQLAKVTNKFTPGIKPFASNVMHTVSGAAINGALRGRIDLEQVAAQMLSNTISTAITPALMNGLAWTESHVFNAQAARQHAEVMHQKPKPVQKKRHVNASKDNVHRLPAAQTNELALSPQAFMRQLGIEGLYSDLNEVMRDLLFTENEQYESYIPSIKMPIAKPLNVMESFLTNHPKLFHFLQRHENAVMGINRALNSLPVNVVTDVIIDKVHNTGYALKHPYDSIIHPTALFLKDDISFISQLGDSKQAFNREFMRFYTPVFTAASNIAMGDSYTRWYTLTSLGIDAIPFVPKGISLVKQGVKASGAGLNRWGMFGRKGIERLPHFASRDLLEGHFGKHGSEFKGAFDNPSEYLKGAHDVINQGIKVVYQYKGEARIGYVKFMGNTSRNGAVKFEFVGTNNKGNITTYHVESGKDFWKLLNGNPQNKNITTYDYSGLTLNGPFKP